MPERSLLQKLKMAPGQPLVLLNASPDWKAFFAETQQVIPGSPGQAECMLVFAETQAMLEKLAADVKILLSETGVVWVAFPKGSSKKQTDLTRDKGWDSFELKTWQYLNLISLDNNWSAFSFRRAGDKPTNIRRALRETLPDKALKPENPYIDTVNRVVNLPEDLGQALAENKAALVFFETLSFTNRKEYVHWVTSARREETRQKRVLETVARLDQGLKNPMEKPNNLAI